jgi:hypothetical protein
MVSQKSSKLPTVSMRLVNRPVTIVGSSWPVCRWSYRSKGLVVSKKKSRAGCVNSRWLHPQFLQCAALPRSSHRWESGGGRRLAAPLRRSLPWHAGAWPSLSLPRSSSSAATLPLTDSLRLASVGMEAEQQVRSTEDGGDRIDQQIAC